MDSSTVPVGRLVQSRTSQRKFFPFLMSRLIHTFMRLMEHTEVFAVPLARCLRLDLG